MPTVLYTESHGQTIDYYSNSHYHDVLRLRSSQDLFPTSTTLLHRTYTMAPHATRADWELYLSILYATSDTREAPWYAPWNIALKDFLFRDFVPWPFFTITYPQFPLTATADTYSEQDEFNDGDEYLDTDDDDDADDDSLYPTSPRSYRHTSMSPDRVSMMGDGSDYIMHTLSSPESSRHSSSPSQQRTMQPVVRGSGKVIRETAPSPESLRYSSSPSQLRTLHESSSLMKRQAPIPSPQSSRYSPSSSPQQPLRPLIWAINPVLRQDAPSPDSYTVPPGKFETGKRSTRIPDFAQLLFEINEAGIDRSILRPVVYNNRIILLVEIKKDDPDFTKLNIVRILPQMVQQARRAFRMSPQILKLGVIAAVANKWIYREFDRRVLEESPLRSHRRDPTYQPSPSQSPVPITFTHLYDPVEHCFGGLGYGCLQEPSSDRALLEVRNRLLEICQMTTQQG